MTSKTYSISDLVDLPISELCKVFDNLLLTEAEENIAKRLLVEIRSRLNFLCDVGLGYLTLNRQSNTLSGGESQRINLATSLGSALVGSLYILTSRQLDCIAVILSGLCRCCGVCRNSETRS